MKKLALNRETVASLTPAQISEVDGGLIPVTIPATNYQTICNCRSIVICPTFPGCLTTTQLKSVCRPCPAA